MSVTTVQTYFDKDRHQVIAELKVPSECVLTLVTHGNPHHDELVAFVIFLQYCSKMFPKLQHVCFDFCQNGEMYRGKNFDDNLKDGYLCVGIGGGPLDEHGSGTKDREKGKCSAILMAEFLQIENLPELQKILDWTCHADLNKVDDPFNLSNKVKRMYRQGRKFHETFEMISVEILAILVEQRQFSEAKVDYDRAVKEKIEYRRGKYYNVVSGVSGNPYFAQYARSKNGCFAAIVIQVNSKGNVQIHSTRFYEGLPFTNVVGLVRVTELKLAGYDGAIDWNQLSASEKVTEVSNWYYHPGINGLFNGSESHGKVIATKIPMEMLRGIVRTALVPVSFAAAMDIIDNPNKPA